MVTCPRLVLSMDCDAPAVDGARAMIPSATREAINAFCDRVLWPFLHGDEGVQRDHTAWNACCEASTVFSEQALALTTGRTSIWVADPRLLLVARALRRAGFSGRIGLYFDVVFPVVEAIERVGWGGELVDAMLAFDRIGFATNVSSDNFIAAATKMRAAVAADGAIASRYRITETELSVRPEEMAQRFFDSSHSTGNVARHQGHRRIR